MGRKLLKTVQTITTFRNLLADPVGTRRGPPLVRGPQFENRWLRHIGKTDPQYGTVQFCLHSGRLTCSARTGFRAVTTPLAELQVERRTGKVRQSETDFLPLTKYAYLFIYHAAVCFEFYFRFCVFCVF